MSDTKLSVHGKRGVAYQQKCAPFTKPCAGDRSERGSRGAGDCSGRVVGSRRVGGAGRGGGERDEACVGRALEIEEVAPAAGEAALQARGDLSSVIVDVLKRGNERREALGETFAIELAVEARAEQGAERATARDDQPPSHGADEAAPASAREIDGA